VGAASPGNAARPPSTRKSIFTSFASAVRLDADLGPCRHDGRMLGLAEQMTGILRGEPRELPERRRGFEPPVAQRLVPDASRLFPRMSAECNGEQVERMVRNARIRVDAPVVGGRVHE